MRMERVTQDGASLIIGGNRKREKYGKKKEYLVMCEFLLLEKSF